MKLIIIINRKQNIHINATIAISSCKQLRSLLIPIIGYSRKFNLCVADTMLGRGYAARPAREI